MKPPTGSGRGEDGPYLQGRKNPAHHVDMEAKWLHAFQCAPGSCDPHKKGKQHIPHLHTPTMAILLLPGSPHSHIPMAMACWPWACNCIPTSLHHSHGPLIPHAHLSAPLWLLR